VPAGVRWDTAGDPRASAFADAVDTP
jgi:hypothetical protein